MTQFPLVGYHHTACLPFTICTYRIKIYPRRNMVCIEFHTPVADVSDIFYRNHLAHNISQRYGDISNGG